MLIHRVRTATANLPRVCLRADKLSLIMANPMSFTARSAQKSKIAKWKIFLDDVALISITSRVCDIGEIVNKSFSSVRIASIYAFRIYVYVAACSFTPSRFIIYAIISESKLYNCGTHGRSYIYFALSREGFNVISIWRTRQNQGPRTITSVTIVPCYN